MADSEKAVSSDESHEDLLAELGIGSGGRAQDVDDIFEKASHSSSDIDVRDIVAELGIGRQGQAREESADESSDGDVRDLVAELGIGSRGQARDAEDSADESSEGDLGGDLVAELGIGTRGRALSDSDDEVPTPYQKLKPKSAEPEFRPEPSTLSSQLRSLSRQTSPEEDDEAYDATLADLPTAFQVVGLPPKRLSITTKIENYDAMQWLMGVDAKARHCPSAGLFSIPVNSMVMGSKSLDLSGAAGAARAAAMATAGQYLRVSGDASGTCDTHPHWQTCSARARRAARSLCMLEHLEAMRKDRKHRELQQLEDTETERWDDAQAILSLGQVAVERPGGALGRENLEVAHQGGRLVLRPEMRRKAEVQAKPFWRLEGSADADNSRLAQKHERKRRIPLSSLSAGILNRELHGGQRLSDNATEASPSEEVQAAKAPPSLAKPGNVGELAPAQPAAKEEMEPLAAANGHEDGVPEKQEQDIDAFVAALDVDSSDSDDGQMRSRRARGVDIAAITDRLEKGGSLSAPARSIRDRMADAYMRDMSEEQLLILAEKEKAAKKAQEQALLAEIRKKREAMELEAIQLREGEFDKLLERERLKEAELLNTVEVVDLQAEYGTFPRELLQEEVVPEISEHVSKYMEERGAVSEAVEAEIAAADVDAARAPPPRSRQPDPNPNADWDFDFSGDGRPFRFARGKVKRVRAGRGWDDLRIARRQLCGKEYMKLAESGGILRPDGVRSVFGGLGECANARSRAHRVFSPHVLAAFRDFIVKWAQKPEPSLERAWQSGGLRFASCGNSELLFEAEILERLRDLGIWISQVCLIGKAYQSPSMSVRRALREFADWQRASAYLDRKVPAEILVFGHLDDYFDAAARKSRAAGCHLFLQCDDYADGVVEECNRLVKRALAPQGMFARLNPQSSLRTTGQKTVPEAQPEAEPADAEAEHSDEAFSVAAWIQEPTGRLDPLYRLRPSQHPLLLACIDTIEEGNKTEDSSLAHAREEALARQRKEARAKVLALADEQKAKEADAIKQNLLQRHKEEIQTVHKRAAAGDDDEVGAVASEDPLPTQVASASLATQANMTPEMQAQYMQQYYMQQQANQQVLEPARQPTVEELQMEKSVKAWEAEEQNFAQYRVTYKPRVIVRAEPKSTGKPVALLYTDEEVIVAPDPHMGWLRIYEGPARAKLPAEAWVCLDATADGLGYMLEQVVRKKSAVPAGA